MRRGGSVFFMRVPAKEKRRHRMRRAWAARLGRKDQQRTYGQAPKEDDKHTVASSPPLFKQSQTHHVAWQRRRLEHRLGSRACLRLPIMSWSPDGVQPAEVECCIVVPKGSQERPLTAAGGVQEEYEEAKGRESKGYGLSAWQRENEKVSW